MCSQIRVIEVVDYDTRWPDDYLAQKELLIAALGNEVEAIHHIGSTSIPGMAAKPTIDILIAARCITAIDSYNSRMEQLGYTAKGEYGIEGRRFFFKGEYIRTHHVHIFQVGSQHLERHLAFRDYMIAHPIIANEYASLKKRLAQKYRHDIDGYCDGKDRFIKDVEIKACRWAKERKIKWN